MTCEEYSLPLHHIEEKIDKIQEMENFKRELESIEKNEPSFQN